MFGDTIIYVTDQRQQTIANNIKGKKRTVDRVDKINWERVGRIIFPTPVSKLKISPYEKGRLKADIIEHKPRVYGGAFSGAVREWLEENSISYYDTALDSGVIAANAVITAEAVIALMATKSSYCINGNKVLLTGFGCCARAIATRLLALGAKVTVLARSREARIEATGLGCTACPFAYGPDEAYGTTVLINTVPALVVTDKIIYELQKDALIIDIASAPGGCDLEAIEESGIGFERALGLPGRYMTTSSGRILADCINRYELSKETQGEDETWIYQIVP